MNPGTLVVPLLVVGEPSADGPRFAAVVFEIAAGWHIYWENPGDTGIATAVALTAPPGLAVGPARFPGPTRFDLAGGLVNYGYEGSAAVIFELTPGDQSGPLSAQTSWLVCRDDRCIPGSASLTADPGQGSVDLDGYRAALPRLLPTGALERHGDTLVVSLPDATSAEIFPGLTLEPSLRGMTVLDEAGGVRCTIGLAPSAAGHAVLSLDGGANRRYYEFTVPERNP